MQFGLVVGGFPYDIFIFFPDQRGFSGSIHTLASDKTHCKPFDLPIPEQWVFG